MLRKKNCVDNSLAQVEKILHVEIIPEASEQILLGSWEVSGA